MTSCEICTNQWKMRHFVANSAKKHVANRNRELKTMDIFFMREEQDQS